MIIILMRKSKIQKRKGGFGHYNSKVSLFLMMKIVAVPSVPFARLSSQSRGQIPLEHDRWLERQTASFIWSDSLIIMIMMISIVMIMIFFSGSKYLDGHLLVWFSVNSMCSLLHYCPFNTIGDNLLPHEKLYWPHNHCFLTILRNCTRATNGRLLQSTKYKSETINTIAWFGGWPNNILCFKFWA